MAIHGGAHGEFAAGNPNLLMDSPLLISGRLPGGNTRRFVRMRSGLVGGEQH